MRLPAVMLLGLVACASSAKAPEVSRPAEAADLSGEWNEIDADLVATHMIRDCLKEGWAGEWKTAHGGKKPVVRLYPIKNRTLGYIDYRFFTKQIERALVISGAVDVVASLEEAADAQKDRQDQSIHASDETQKQSQRELGSDFVLNGWILLQEDEGERAEIRAYLVSLELTEVETQRKAWIGQKRIRKQLKR